ncbi:hypothetical protein [Actinoplanes sp. NPDC026670]|uniref:hypothetical protein n=1 Tax=Actinoplanes sp. NPDC026670 TaxID=3154700 RepID=UPI0033C823A2
MNGPADFEATNADAMVASRRADTARRRQRVLDAVELAAAQGDGVTVSDVARMARVHRAFIYRHPDLLERVRSLEHHE